MNGNNHIENRLNELFAKAKQQEPLLSSEDVHNLITHAPTSVFPGKQLVNYVKSHLKLTIMTTIVSIILISYFIGSGSSPATNEVANPPKIISEEGKNVQNSTATSKTVGTLLNTLEKVNLTVNSSNFLDIKHQANSYNTDSASSRINLPECSQQLSGDEFMLSLTVDEFCKLGFFIKDTVFYHYNLNSDSIVSGFLYYDNYYRKNLNNLLKKGFDFSASNVGIRNTYNDFYPVCLTNRFFLSGFRVLANYKGLEDYDLKLYITTYNNLDFPDYQSDLKIRKKIIDTTSNAFPLTIRKFTNQQKMFFRPDFFELYNDTLVPVIISGRDSTKKLTNNSKFEENIIQTFSDHIFWFKSSNAFYDALPDRYRNKTKEFYENIKKLKLNSQCSDKNIVYYPSFSFLKKAVMPIKKIGLENKELEKLGFIIKPGALQYRNQNINKDSLYILLSNNISYVNFGSQLPKRTIKVLETHNISIPEIPQSFPLYDFSPLFVTNMEGKRIIQWYNQTSNTEMSLENYFSDITFIENINRLIAIEIKNDFAENMGDLIFWFNPTEAFFDSLPPRIGNEIREEYHALLIRTDPSIPLAIKEKAPAICTYFEECLPTFPNLKNFKVYPNPANKEVKIDIELANPDKIRIILFDINGRPLNILKDCEEEMVGQHCLNIPLTNFPDGIYILTIQNTNGDYKTQRIIKQ
jgi:hypothetical protein